MLARLCRLVPAEPCQSAANPPKTQPGKRRARIAPGGYVMAAFDRITVDPAVMGGQPCVRGMRLTVRRVVEAVSIYRTWDAVIAEYPELEAEDIRQALEYAATSLDDRVIELPAA